MQRWSERGAVVRDGGAERRADAVRNREAILKAGLEVLSDEYRSSAGTAIGGVGERVFTLAAPAASGEARFELKRSWGSGTPERTFTFQVDKLEGNDVPP